MMADIKEEKREERAEGIKPSFGFWSKEDVQGILVDAGDSGNSIKNPAIRMLLHIAPSNVVWRYHKEAADRAALVLEMPMPEQMYEGLESPCCMADMRQYKQRAEAFWLKNQGAECCQVLVHIASTEKDIPIPQYPLYLSIKHELLDKAVEDLNAIITHLPERDKTYYRVRAVLREMEKNIYESTVPGGGTEKRLAARDVRAAFLGVNRTAFHEGVRRAIGSKDVCAAWDENPVIHIDIVIYFLQQSFDPSFSGKKEDRDSALELLSFSKDRGRILEFTKFLEAKVRAERLQGPQIIEILTKSPVLLNNSFLRFLLSYSKEISQCIFTLLQPSLSYRVTIESLSDLGVFSACKAIYGIALRKFDGSWQGEIAAFVNKHEVKHITLCNTEEVERSSSLFLELLRTSEIAEVTFILSPNFLNADFSSLLQLSQDILGREGVQKIFFASSGKKTSIQQGTRAYAELLGWDDFQRYMRESLSLSVWGERTVYQEGVDFIFHQDPIIV